MAVRRTNGAAMSGHIAGSCQVAEQQFSVPRVSTNGCAEETPGKQQASVATASVGCIEGVGRLHNGPLADSVH